MTFFDTILDFIFPIKCLACGASGSYFCSKCLSDSPSAERESAEWIFPLFDYRHPPVKKAIWLLKYKGRKKIAGAFADAMYGRIIEELSELKIMENFGSPILVPVPLSKKRLRERGFNQAELLCTEILRLDQNNYLSLKKYVLVKSGDTEHQARIKNRAERLKNLAGTFTVRGIEAVKGRNIILIDDVTTTGATLSEAKKILKLSGARKVIAFTLAH